ncbi:flagellar motor switch protein FliN [Thiomicrospira aerophila AL3]|uniref:Flagellar motor switch protein FliN n=1 Tax=Thiomicrospira aerophila AL3 TaxID=717772 RepID=W0DSZ8_9GAMM|nr:flagellar motor switch protein FliN [Thiomicrospira aerophila]AHF01572.1 flagellar motor switch protein FliN [Thiomicrospira aerophila AL3]
MTDKEDDADWGDALAEQAAAEGGSDEAADDPWAAALNEQADAADSVSKEVDIAGLEALRAQDSSGREKVDLDVLLDIPVTLQLEIGRAKVSIRNLLSYTQGSIVEMDRLAGEPLDLLVNGTLIAHGEVVVVNDKFGVRLTDVISPQERIKKLR